ncbi:LysR family transcriptional regulator [Nocardioides conyzicola]|uniref:LysR family transcriptional regulator n=1 Tax=Nocardioides conyzicola TaxID=1651781 RepID=UPI0031E82144
MDIRTVKHFVVVAEELSVTRAAERLSAAQSTVSAALRSLERELGVTLLDRTTRRVSLTEDGKRVLPEARALVSAYERMHSSPAEGALAELRSRVRVGLSAPANVLDLPHLIRIFSERHPQDDLVIMAARDGLSDPVDDLRQGRVDLVVSASPVESGTDIEVEAIAEFPFVALLPTDHRLGGRRRLRLKDLAGEPWIDTAAGSSNRVILDAELARRGLQRHLVAELRDLAAISSFVAAGVGVAVIPDAVSASGCTRVPIADAPYPWALFLCWRRDVSPSVATQEFCDLIRQSATRNRGRRPPV